MEPNSKPGATNDRTTPDRETEKGEATQLIASGIGIGVLGSVAAVISGAICPVCVVAAPALIGVGAYRRWRASRPRSASAEEQTGPDGEMSARSSRPSLRRA